VLFQIYILHLHLSIFTLCCKYSN